MHLLPNLLAESRSAIDLLAPDTIAELADGLRSVVLPRVTRLADESPGLELVKAQALIARALERLDQAVPLYREGATAAQASINTMAGRLGPPLNESGVGSASNTKPTRCPIRNPATIVETERRRTVFKPEHLTRVVDHLRRPGIEPAPKNGFMINSIRQSLAQGDPLSEAQQNFMRHELAEAQLVDDGSDLEEAHHYALQTHPPMRNYSPETIEAFPSEFNNLWRQTWGMSQRP